jgi:hypothetical protein
MTGGPVGAAVPSPRFGAASLQMSAPRAGGPGAPPREGPSRAGSCCASHAPHPVDISFGGLSLGFGSGRVALASSGDTAFALFLGGIPRWRRDRVGSAM